MRVSSAKTNNAIAVQGLRVRLAGTVVLDDVYFDVPTGSMTAIIGPNGSGKTTLLRAILGLVDIEHGAVTLFGGSREEMRHRIGYVPQRFEFDRTFPITVREFLGLARRATTEVAHVAHTIREVGLPPSVLHKRIGALSGGQLQRVLIAQAILNNPDLLVLDEPVTGIDVAGEEAVMQVLTHLKETHGTTIVIVSHDISMIADAVDEVVCVNRRLICAGPPNKTLTHKRLTELYGNNVHPIDHSHPHG